MKINLLASKLIVSLAILLFFDSFLLAQNSSYVWSNQDGSGRQQKVLFRNSFEIKTLPDTAIINLFASSRYHIYVNGTHLNFGPSRFYPQNPRYDSYDISPYLQTGKNVVAVEVLANGMETFQIFESIGSLIAWGKISTGKNGLHSFDTPGTWKFMQVESMDTLTPKFSFACGALEIFDARKEPSGWKSWGFYDTDWKKPLLISNQKYWGKLEVRQIPELTQNETTAFRCMGIYGLSTYEKFYSFYQKIPDENQFLYNWGERLAGYTWVYSPSEQLVELGTWWGEYYLNGEGPLRVLSPDSLNPVRENRNFNLKKGWNFLYVNYQAIWGAWEFTLAVPTCSGIEFSGIKKHGSDSFFRTTAALNKTESDQITDAVKKGNESLEKLPGQIKWLDQKNEIPFKNPARDLVWNQPDISLNLVPNDYQTVNFSESNTRFFVYDMGRKMLGRIFLDIDAPDGTIIDLGWSEDLNQFGLPNLYKSLQINASARFICDTTQSRYETFKPYGVRHMLVKITPPTGTTAVLKNIGVIEQVYPYTRKGNFECSDPMLNKIWEMGWRTLRVCSEDSYIDTPFRERGLYAGDALPEYAITLATSGDSRLMKNSLLLFRDMYQEEMEKGINNRHNDFILKTLLELEWYYKYTGDSAFVKKLLPNYITYLDVLEKNKTQEGYYKVGMVFLEWTKINKTADLTAYQALLYRSMRILESMSSDFGLTENQLKYQSRADALKKVIIEQFWDKEKRCFFDGFEKGNKIGHYYPISSFYPLLFQVVSDETQKENIINFLDKELKDIGEETRNRKVTPYGSFYLFAALYDNQQAGVAERFMKQYWTRMILQGDDTSWENFDIVSEKSGGGQGTASHAWSGHPTYFLSTEVLGVKLGFNQPFSRDTIFIQPQSETLSWAKGTVPHPQGDVGVSWHIAGDNLFLDLRIPKNVPCEIQPKGRLASYKLISTVTRYPQ